MSKKIVFLGNSLYLEDKIGLVVGELLREELASRGYEVEVSERIGISLLDLFLEESYDEIIIVDSVYVDKEDLYGEVFVVDVEKLSSSSITYPHDLSIRDIIDLLRLQRNLGEKKILVIGIGIRDLYTLSNDLSEYLRNRISYIKNRVLELIYLFSRGS